MMNGAGPGGTRVRAFVQAQDFMPTWLSLLGATVPDGVTGHDAWPLATGQAASARDYCITAYGAYVGVRDAEWNYIRRVGGLYAGEEGVAPQLYHVLSDPLEEQNVVADNPAVVETMEARLQKRLDGSLDQRD